MQNTVHNFYKKSIPFCFSPLTFRNEYMTYYKSHLITFDHFSNKKLLLFLWIFNNIFDISNILFQVKTDFSGLAKLPLGVGKCFLLYGWK